MRGGKNIALLVGKVLLAGALLLWLLQSGRMDLSMFADLRWSWLLVGVLVLQLLMLILPVVRWYYLAKALNLELSPRQTLRVGMVGYFANIFLPTGLGIDGTKILYMRRWNPGRSSDVLTTVLMDRIMGMASMAAIGIAALGLFLIWQHDGRFARVISVMVYLLLGLAVALMALLSRRVSGKLITLLPWEPVRSMLDSFRKYRGRTGVLCLAFAISMATHFSNMLAAWFALVLLGAAVPLLPVCAFTPMVNLSGFLPLTPLGLGIADSCAEGLYSMIGVQQGAEGTMLLRAATVLLSSLGVFAVVQSPIGEAESSLSSSAWKG